MSKVHGSAEWKFWQLLQAYHASLGGRLSGKEIKIEGRTTSFEEGKNGQQGAGTRQVCGKCKE